MVVDTIDQKFSQNSNRMHASLIKVGRSRWPLLLPARGAFESSADGYIDGYSARIDEAKMGFGFTVFVSVKLDKQVDSQLGDFERQFANAPKWWTVG